MSNARKLGNMTTHGLDGDFNVDPTDNTLVVNSTNNRVGIGSATPTTTLDITGTATATAFSGPLTGNVTGTTSSISNHNTDALSEGSTNLYFTNARADARAQLKIDALVDSAPNTLDTLNELAAALGDDANFSTTITNSIATKMPAAGGTFTGDVTFDGDAGNIVFDKSHDSLSFFQAAALKFVSTSATNQQSRIQWDGTRTHWETFNNTRVDLDGDFRLVGQSYNVEWDKSANALEFAANAKATFGAGSDLQIYHDGSNSYIDDAGTGNLTIRANQINFNKYTGEALARFRADGNTELFYDNASKLTTTSTGVDVTGTVTADGLTVDGSTQFDNYGSTTGKGRIQFGNSGQKFIEGFDTGNAGSGSYLKFGSGSTTQMTLNNSGHLKINNGNLQIERNGSSPLLQFTNTGGNSRWIGLVSGTDNFTIYGTNGSTQELTLDGSGNVGIGVIDPDSALEVQSSSANKNSVHIANTSSTSYGAKFLGGGNTATRYIADFRDYNNLSKVKIDGDGRVLMTHTLDVIRGAYGAYQALNLENTNGNHSVLSGVSLAMRVAGGLAKIDMYNSSNTDTDSSNIIFKTGDGGAATERMRIDSSGRVKIGTNETTIGDQQLFISGTKTSFANTSFSLWQNQLAVHDNRIPSGGAGTEAGVGGSISFTAEAGGGQKTWLGLVEGYKQNNTAGDYGGGLKMRVRQHNNATMLTGISIDSTARVTMPNQPSFNAQRTSNQGIQGGTTLVFNAVRHNTGNHYNSGTGVFTAPVTGDYLFTFKALFYAFASSEYLDLYSTVNGITRNRYEQTGNNGQHTQIDYTEVVRLNANDGFYFYANNRNSSATLYSMYGNENHFSGYLLG